MKKSKLFVMLAVMLTALLCVRAESAQAIEGVQLWEDGPEFATSPYQDPSPYYDGPLYVLKVEEKSGKVEITDLSENWFPDIHGEYNNVNADGIGVPADWHIPSEQDMVDLISKTTLSYDTSTGEYRFTNDDGTQVLSLPATGCWFINYSEDTDGDEKDGYYATTGKFLRLYLDGTTPKWEFVDQEWYGAEIFLVRYSSPHTHGTGTDAITFAKSIKTLSDLQNLFTNGGSGYLAEDIVCSETTGVLSIMGNVDLCLNDHVLKLADNVNISVVSDYSLRLYDCGDTVRYYDKDVTTGLWTLNTEKTSGDYSTVGGVITGGNVTTNGGAVYVNGTFDMYGGNITGNRAEYGGGVDVTSGQFNMIDGSIVGNIATYGGGVSNTNKFTMVGGHVADNTATNGGGIYTAFMATNVLTGGIVNENSATVGGGLYAKEEKCFAAGTMITMADGTKKAVETLSIGDTIRVFDHEKGEVSTAPLFDAWKYPEKHSNVVTLHFTNYIDVTVVGGHSFFSRNENKYVAVTKDNVSLYVGHEFYNVDDARWEKLIG